MDKDKFNQVAPHPLQSWEWGEFREKWGNQVIRLPFGQLTLHRIPFTPYKIGMFIKGPSPTQKMLDELKDLAKKENLIFIKLEPNVVKDEKIINLLEKSGAVRGKTLFTPSTFWIDLTRSEEELMQGFSSKTRYNIRYALKSGVGVAEDNSEAAFKKYLELTKETVERQGFYAHSTRYHKLMWKFLHLLPISYHQSPIARLLTARYKGEVITTWILLSWRGFLYYPYGASTERHKNVMANNLMMWEAIRFGKRLGLKTFDLWGREEGKGFTKFKEGYNPKVIEFLGTWDLVINKPAYFVYRLAEAIRWPLLRFKSKLTKPSF